MARFVPYSRDIHNADRLPRASGVDGSARVFRRDCLLPYQWRPHATIDIRIRLYTRIIFMPETLTAIIFKCTL